MTDDDKALVELLLRIGERVPVSCPDGIEGCLVYHFRTETNPTCKEAADRIEAQAAEIKAILDREADTYRRHDAKVDALEAENERLREALLDVLVYAPDYMHGMPKKHYEKIALGEKP